MSSNGAKATTPFQKAELLNSFFSSVFTSENLNVLPELDYLHYEYSLSSVSITSDIVFNKLSALKSNKLPGPDGLHPLALKEAATQLQTLSGDIGPFS